MFVLLPPLASVSFLFCTYSYYAALVLLLAFLKSYFYIPAHTVYM